MEYRYGISVIVPVYNVEKYLRDCLDSILQQDFTDYEVICINDASTDTSIKILREYQEKHKSLKIVEHTVNRGLSAARNTGLDCAKGKYIMFVDSDDMIEQGSMKELYQMAEENKTDILCFNRTDIYEGEMEKIYKSLNRKSQTNKEICTGKEVFCQWLKENDFKYSVCQKMFLKCFLDENGLNFYEGIYYEDVIFSFLVLIKAKRVMEYNKSFYICRKRHFSITTTVNDKCVQSYYIVWMEIFKYWNAHMFDNATNCAIAQYMENMFWHFRKFEKYSKQGTKLEYGTLAEQKLYELLTKKKTAQYATLSVAKLNELAEQDAVIVYGAGAVAAEIIDLLYDNHISVCAVAVTDKSTNANQFQEIEIKQIQDLVEYKDQAVVVIAVTEKYYRDIKETLQNVGFYKIMKVDYLPRERD